MPPAAQQALQLTAERGGETAAVASWSPGPGRPAAFTSAAAERPVRWAAEGDRDLITGENILQTLAEVSIAFTGFSGVVGVFGGGSALSNAERALRVRMMITASLAAFFGSLLPLVLGQFDSAAPLVWPLCCASFAGFFIVDSVGVYRRTGALAAVGNYSRPWFAPIIYTINAVVALALILGAGAFLPGHSVYIGAIAWQLVLASLQFMLLVTQTKPRPAV